jgi:hypothetical protein
MAAEPYTYIAVGWIIRSFRRNAHEAGAGRGLSSHV